MAAAFHSSIVGKVLFVVAATIVALLFSTGHAPPFSHFFSFFFYLPETHLQVDADLYAYEPLGANAVGVDAGYAGEAPPPPEFKYPPCQTLALPLPECQRYCKDIGFQHGGFIKGDDVCCCNS